MSLKTWAPLGLALVLGLVALMVGQKMMKPTTAAPETNTKVTQVAITLHDIAPGAELHAIDLKLGSVGNDSVPDSSFHTLAELEGRVVKTQLVKGQAIVEPLLAEKGQGTGLQSLIPEGMRAITIEVNEFTGVGGMIIPGCHVDVMATLPGDNNEQMSRAVVQNVLITAVGKRVTPNSQPAEGEAFRNVTIVATPKQVAAIELASSTARPRLILRSGRDKDFTDLAQVTTSELRGKKGNVNDAFAKDNGKGTSTAVSNMQGSARRIKVIKNGVETEVQVDNSQTVDTSDAPKATPTSPLITGADLRDATGR